MSILDIIGLFITITVVLLGFVRGFLWVALNSICLAFFSLLVQYRLANYVNFWRTYLFDWHAEIFTYCALILTSFLLASFLHLFITSLQNRERMSLFNRAAGCLFSFLLVALILANVHSALWLYLPQTYQQFSLNSLLWNHLLPYFQLFGFS